MVGLKWKKNIGGNGLKKLGLLFVCMMLFTVSSCTSISTEPPNVQVTAQHKKAETRKGGYEWSSWLFSRTSVGADASSQWTETMHRLSIDPGQKATVSFSNRSHPKFSAHLYNQYRKGSALPVHKNTITLPTKPGIYVILIQAHWRSGKSDYAFSVNVDK